MNETPFRAQIKPATVSAKGLRFSFKLYSSY